MNFGRYCYRREGLINNLNAPIDGTPRLQDFWTGAKCASATQMDSVDGLIPKHPNDVDRLPYRQEDAETYCVFPNGTLCSDHTDGSGCQRVIEACPFECMQTCKAATGLLLYENDYDQDGVHLSTCAGTSHFGSETACCPAGPLPTPSLVPSAPPLPSDALQVLVLTSRVLLVC